MLDFVQRVVEICLNLTSVLVVVNLLRRVNLSVLIVERNSPKSYKENQAQRKVYGLYWLLYFFVLLEEQAIIFLIRVVVGIPMWQRQILSN